MPLPQRELLNFTLRKQETLKEGHAQSLDTQDLKFSDIENERRIVDESGVSANGNFGLGPRRGVMKFGSVEVETPVFMPVGTAGSVKALSPDDVSSLGYNLILGNTYHLNLRPGMEVMEKFEGLHNFMRWPGVTLTDSGGFQVMSLAKIRKLTEDGVTFASHIDGSKISLTPENVVGIQETLDSDIQMVLDECTPYPASFEQASLSMERSMRWAARARMARKKLNRAQFGIVQGGMYGPLRAKSALELQKIGFEGYAIGGLSVGESKREMRRVLSATLPYLPVHAPRYLMGVGTPEDIVDGVLLGIDMFDCVLPTRNARNGSVFVRRSAESTVKLQIKNSKHRLSERALDDSCLCYTCKNFSRSYLRHLFIANELLVYRLLTLHNLSFFADLTATLRQKLDAGELLASIPEIRNEFVPLRQP